MHHFSASMHGEIIHLGNNRHLLYDITQEAVGAVAMAPSKNPCLNSPNGMQCQPAPSTLVIVISGLCAMMLLIVIAIVLLCCSHFKYRQRVEDNEQASGEANPPMVPAAPLESSTCDTVVLVLLPGEKHPVTFAQPRPLIEEDPGNESEQASSNVNKIKSVDVQRL